MKNTQYPLLCSHNTFTYLKPRKWYHYICIPFARCQNKNINKQIEEGIQIFDIRVRFDKNGNVIVCHGLFEVKLEVPIKQSNGSYKLMSKIDSNEFINYLLSIADSKDKEIYFRLVLEISKKDRYQELMFQYFCEIFFERIKTNYRINLLCCVRKFDWKCLFDTTKISHLVEFQHISSYPAYKESIKPRFYERICPWLYAKRTNKKYKYNFKQGLYNHYDYVSYDFV